MCINKKTEDILGTVYIKPELQSKMLHDNWMKHCGHQMYRLIVDSRDKDTGRLNYPELRETIDLHLRHSGVQPNHYREVMYWAEQNVRDNESENVKGAFKKIRW